MPQEAVEAGKEDISVKDLSHKPRTMPDEIISIFASVGPFPHVVNHLTFQQMISKFIME